MVKKQMLAAALLLGTNVIANPIPGNEVESLDKRDALDVSHHVATGAAISTRAYLLCIFSLFLPE